MNWGSIFAAVAGGLLALSGELIGRIGAARQARRLRQELIEDRQAAHDQAVRDEEQREVRQRSRLAAENILATMLHNVVAVRDPRGADLEDVEVSKRAIAILSSIYLESPFVTDDVLRDRLGLAHAALDLATTPGVGLGVDTRVIIHNVRNNVVDWITESLRGEPLSEPSASWRALVPLVLEARAKWAEMRLTAYGEIAYIASSPAGEAAGQRETR